MKFATEIGPIRPAERPERVEACKRDFYRFCKTYMPEFFSGEETREERLHFEQIARAVLDGESATMQRDRGRGKSTTLLAAVVWVMAYEHKRSMLYLHRTHDYADMALKQIEGQCTHSEELAQDFPILCNPFRAIDGIRQRIAGLRIDGEKCGFSIGQRRIRTAAYLERRGVDVYCNGVLHGVSGIYPRPEFVVLDEVHAADHESPTRNALIDRRVREALRSGAHFRQELPFIQF